MRFDVDPAKVLYAVGVVFGIAAVLYFARDIVFDLSITVRALLLLLAFVVFLVAAVGSDRTSVVLVSSVLSAAAYLAFLGYTLSRFDVGADGTFLALLVSAALFLGLGYLVRERRIFPSPRTARYAVVGVLLVAVLMVGVDLIVSDVGYDVTIEDEGVVDDGGEVVVGTLTVDNQFVFREPIDVPEAFACLFVPGMDEYEMRPQPIQYRVGEDRVPDSVPGGTTITARMTVRLADEEASTVDGPIPIERVDACPDESENPRIVVVMGDDMPRPQRP